MTEKIIKKENIEYKLICNLSIEWNRPAKYKFKLQQREQGKRNVKYVERKTSWNVPISTIQFIVNVVEAKTRMGKIGILKW